METKHKLDRKSETLAIISGIILVVLILCGLGCLIDYFDPGSVGSHSPLLLLAALIAIVLAFLIYRQLRVWGGMVNVRHP
jgi:Ca2+/Na+ antiporter